MAQQTAVDWLEDVYNTQGRILPAQFEQAKQMFWEQIVKAHGLRYYDLTEEVITGDQYYTKTYAQ